MIKFFKSVGHEMKLVHWPSAKENRRDTLNVVVTSLLYAIFLGALDWVFEKLIQIVL
ncbi:MULTISPECIES: preprotein translocase subunit SecE [Lactobacillus]|jgi:preprotein translocase subunit SecE|uniref:Preprotein translocase subunit SecE n=1 Tax=Lactobacillus porci TaxID=2012477 RepID=A0A6A8MFF0_9LACO|nr:preprotein translocase subunit SecE [Lactobacillus porci]MDD6415838.1 preprotein translocase subunit SecE [Lactobacillus porci]MDD6719527.1 preprotein translocase subunit SecE [Lactobacillus porci]MST87528.1 preprotein translocase subunit SecE [Lactobacillus porci]